MGHPGFVYIMSDLLLGFHSRSRFTGMLQSKPLVFLTMNGSEWPPISIQLTGGSYILFIVSHIGTLGLHIPLSGKQGPAVISHKLHRTRGQNATKDAFFWSDFSRGCGRVEMDKTGSTGH